MTDLSMSQVGSQLIYDQGIMEAIRFSLDSATFLEDPALSQWNNVSDAMTRLFNCYSQIMGNVASGLRTESDALPALQTCEADANADFSECRQAFKRENSLPADGVKVASNVFYSIFENYYALTMQTPKTFKDALHKYNVRAFRTQYV